jgi:uncharacterized protein (TIGR03546 family)
VIFSFKQQERFQVPPKILWINSQKFIREGSAMFWLNLAIKIVTTLHSDESPRALALGLSLGSIIGLTPFLSAHNLIIFVLIFILNVSISAAMFGVFFFGLFAWFFDPLFHDLGYFLLVNLKFLKPFWTYLYNIPVAPLFRLNNTVVLGSLVASLITFLPVYFGFQKALALYKLHLREKVEKFKIMKMIKANSLYQLYTKIKSFGIGA